MMGWYGGAMGPLAGLAIIVFWVVMFVLIVWAVGRLLPGSSAETTVANSESAWRSLTAGWRTAKSTCASAKPGGAL
jgi:hypothetical protein